jgi:probable addiction module antidote protein
MPKRTAGDFNSWHLEKLSNPTNAANYLNAVLEDSPELILDAVKDVVQARKVSEVAKQAGVTRESIYRTFSAGGNPTLETLKGVFQALNIQISGFKPASLHRELRRWEIGKTPTIRSRHKRRRGTSGRFFKVEGSVGITKNPRISGFSVTSAATGSVNSGVRFILLDEPEDVMGATVPMMGAALGTFPQMGDQQNISHPPEYAYAG